MDEISKQFKVIGYRHPEQAEVCPDFEKIVFGRSEASRLAVMLKNSTPPYDRITIINSEGRSILDLEG